MNEEKKWTRDLLEWDFPAEVMSILLKDRTTGKNIIWASDDYESRGEGFAQTDEILPELICTKDDPVIRPRVDKSKGEQKNRVVKKAEVFTPPWICNKQNNLVDAAWFGWKRHSSSPFNRESGEYWIVTEKPIRFSRGKNWQEYVRAARLEVACGEAPYLASRYNAVSGQMIPVKERIGLLDRKLRVVSENVGDDVQDWLYHAKRALQSVYGFDWQGDNVLLARENLLATIIETYNALFFGEESSALRIPLPYLIEYAEIVSWNVWQMDGIRNVVPMSCKRVETSWLELDGTPKFSYSECPGCAKKDKRQHTGIYCNVMDWSQVPPQTLRFVDLQKG